MSRLTSLCALLLLAALLGSSHGLAGEAAAVPKAAAAPAIPASAASTSAIATRIDADVALFNPDIYSLDESGAPVFGERSLFREPATEVARQVLSVTWFSSIVFLPFLILPQLLLLVVIFKFKDRGDGRKPATFLG